MDPNITLEMIRHNAAMMQNDIDNGHADWDRMQELVEQIQTLDTWLTKGGFYPRDWSKAYLDSNSELLRAVPGHIRHGNDNGEEPEHFGGMR